MQSHLTSYGCIQLSHQNNTDGYEGRRPRVLLNADALIEQQDLIEGGILAGHIDATRIAIIRHSLAREEVVIAAHQLAVGKYAPDYYEPEALRLVCMIAATSAVEERQGGTTHEYPTHLL